jgi:hypothetical protein
MDKIKPVPVVEVGASNNRAYVNELCMSVGNVSSKDYPAPKTSGIKTRGNGAASKGTTARGPMA